MIPAMRKTPRTHIIGLLVCLLLPFTAEALAQGTPPGPQAPAPAVTAGPPDPLHANPGAFMAEAARRNGLQAFGLAPWHLKVSFRLFDDNGQLTDTGIVEEYHASPLKYRLSYASIGFKSIFYETGKGDLGDFRTGDQTPVPEPLSELRPAFLNPFPPPFYLRTLGLVPVDPTGRGITFSCVNMKPKPGGMDGALGSQSQALEGMYCFEPGKYELKVSMPVRVRPTGSVPLMIARTNLISFGGLSIPVDLAVVKGGKVALAAHLETIEPLTAIDETLFDPPADAKFYPMIKFLPPPPPPPPPTASATASPAFFGHDIKMISEKAAPSNAGGVAGMEGSAMAVPPNVTVSAPKQVNISAGVAAGLILKKTVPVYPALAKAARVQGTVVLQGTISKEGTVENLRVISGSPMLTQAAIDAVEQWVYRPYLLMGEPVEVETQINVIFTLGEPPKPASPNASPNP